MRVEERRNQNSGFFVLTKRILIIPLISFYSTTFPSTVKHDLIIITQTNDVKVNEAYLNKLFVMYKIYIYISITYSRVVYYTYPTSSN